MFEKPPAPSLDSTLDAVDTILNSVPEELSVAWRKRISEKIDVADVDDIETYEQADRALSLAQNMLKARQDALSGGVSVEMRKESPEYADMIQETLTLIASSTDNHSNILGTGAVAEVYVSNVSDKVCYKLVTNIENYAKNNTVDQEADFLKKLTDLSVRGTRVPEVYFTVNDPSSGMKVIGMEALDAVGLQKVLDGIEELPDTFDPDTFFFKLHAYVEQMHERGIFHNDIFSRNIMVDKESGDPRLIDFGKSEELHFMNDKEGAGVGDVEGIKQSKREIREYLKKVDGNK